VVTVVVINDPKNEDKNPAPTTTPSVDEATINALDTILDPLMDEDMPVDDARRQARDWILYEDLLRDERLAGPSFAVIQRFCLAELYFSTNGDTWTRSDSTDTNATAFLTPEASECEWDGVTCEVDATSELHLRRINLSNRNLTGILPQSLGALPQIAEIDLANNFIGGPLPNAWFTYNEGNAEDEDEDTVVGMSSLFVLELEGNKLTGTIPLDLWTRPVMRFLYLNDNQLEGPVFGDQDSETIASPYWEDIWLQNNALTGPLPSWLFQQPSLKTFWADNNKFSGNLPEPPEFLGDSSLYWFSVGNNSLNGPLLDGHLAGSLLEDFHVHQNQLTGSLPSADFKSGILSTVWLQENRFSGVLPLSFGTGWSALTELFLTGNPDLAGAITNAQCVVWEMPNDENMEETFEVDCPQMTCACCTNEACMP
jgi:hypothetical protein